MLERLYNLDPRDVRVLEHNYIGLRDRHIKYTEYECIPRYSFYIIDRNVTLEKILSATPTVFVGTDGDDMVFKTFSCYEEEINTVGLYGIYFKPGKNIDNMTTVEYEVYLESPNIDTHDDFCMTLPWKFDFVSEPVRKVKMTDQQLYGLLKRESWEFKDSPHCRTEQCFYPSEFQTNMTAFEEFGHVINLGQYQPIDLYYPQDSTIPYNVYSINFYDDNHVTYFRPVNNEKIIVYTLHHIGMTCIHSRTETNWYKLF